MILLDTDTLTLYFSGHARVTQRVESAPDVPATTVISRIEMLQGRFDSLVKAGDARQLMMAQDWLRAVEHELAKMAIVPFNVAGAAEFDRLRSNKKLKKIGRKDLLIASIALANRATLVTRNLRHFRKCPGCNWRTGRIETSSPLEGKHRE